MIIPNTAELQKDSQNTILIFLLKHLTFEQIKKKNSRYEKNSNDDSNIWVISKSRY